MWDKLYTAFDKIVSNPFFNPISTLIIIGLTFGTLFLMSLQIFLNWCKSRPKLLIENLRIIINDTHRQGNNKSMILNISLDIKNSSIVANSIIKAIISLKEPPNTYEPSKHLTIQGKTTEPLQLQPCFTLPDKPLQKQYIFEVTIIDQYNKHYYKNAVITTPEKYLS